MSSKSFCNRQRRLASSLFLAAIFALSPALAAAPEWLRALASAPLPNTGKFDAITLLDEQVTTVRDAHEIRTTHRYAGKILRPGGRTLGRVVIPFDSETVLSNVRGWSLSPQGKDVEVRERDAVETGLASEALYADARVKVLVIPGAEPGSLIGYEYEQRRRPMILQDIWRFQGLLPVVRARFSLQLPSGWEFETFWLNRSAVESKPAGERRWVWEVQDLPGIEPEPGMPNLPSIVGRLAISYFPSAAGTARRSHGSWRDVGLWYYELASPRRQPNAEIRRKVMELTATAPSAADKIGALASFVQRDIRYVAIEIGAGSHVPHSAPEILTSRYGDCKDKATLLGAMLHEVGIDSYYVLAHNRRGMVSADFPTALAFNHAILAVRLADRPTGTLSHATVGHDRLGALLFFDPTDEFTPLGYLPAELQGSRVLLVTEAGGELVELPAAPPAVNRLVREAGLALTAEGTLTGSVIERYYGALAVQHRQAMVAAPGLDRAKVLESFLSRFLGGFSLLKVQVENLRAFEGHFGLLYDFSAPNYAKRAGNLLLLRPRAMGRKRIGPLEDQDRKYPLEVPVKSEETDTFDITLPEGFEVDEMPPAVKLDFPFARYESRSEVKGRVLRYERRYEARDLSISVEAWPQVRELHRAIAADENANAVLRRRAN